MAGGVTLAGELSVGLAGGVTLAGELRVALAGGVTLAGGLRVGYVGWRCHSGRRTESGVGLMSKIQNDRLFKPYPHDQSSTCQNIGKVIVMYYM